MNELIWERELTEKELILIEKKELTLTEFKIKLWKQAADATRRRHQEIKQRKENTN